MTENNQGKKLGVKHPLITTHFLLPLLLFDMQEKAQKRKNR